MSDDDDDYHDEPASPAQAFAGLQNHVDGYKSYLRKLKKGASSGISAVFGVASELLPAEHLQENEYSSEHFDPDKSILKNASPPGVLREALEQTIVAFSQGNEEASRIFGAGEPGDQPQVIGEVFEGGKRILIYADMTSTEAPFPSRPATTESIVELDPLVDALASEVNSSEDSPSQMAAELQPARAVADAPTPDYVRPNGNDSDTIEHQPVSQHVRDKIVVQAQPLPADNPVRHADLRVTAATGEALWDIILTGDSLSEVYFSDGSRILASNEPDLFVYVPSPHSGLESSTAEIITNPIYDPETGNLFIRLASGGRATAFLNNGFRIDQYQNDEGEDDFFVTEPYKPGSPVRSRTRVNNLTMDQDTGSVSYDTIDGGLSVTMRYRKL